MNNDFKQKLQEREFQTLKDKQRVILKWATGCGKSKMVIDLINHAVDSFSDKPVKVLFLVAERAHIKNWEDEFSKWQLRRGEISTDVACYASLKKYYLYDIYDIIVLDEAHHIFTEKRMEMLKEMEAPERTPANQRVYLLSATLSGGKQDMAENIFGKFTVSTVTLKDAIKSDILPDPRVYVVGMELDNTKKYQEIKIGNNPKAPIVKWEDRKKYIYKNTPCIIQCTEYQKNQYLTEKIEY
jgi:superfamily II DNA or RNA helicase